jgi:hypothetical protein
MRIKGLLTICLLIMIALWGCGSEPQDGKDKPMAAGEIMQKYVNTLTTAQGKARAAGKAVEDRTRRTHEAIDD